MSVSKAFSSNNTSQANNSEYAAHVCWMACLLCDKLFCLTPDFEEEPIRV